MKTNKTITALVGLMSAGALASSQAGEPPAVATMTEAEPVLSGSLAAGYDSMYNFRGVDFGPDAIWAGVDFNMALSDSVGLNVGTWYTGGSDSLDELDLYAFITTSCGDLDVSVGGTAFFFTEDDSTAQELGVILGYAVGPIDLGTIYYYDFETEGSYIELNAGTTIELNDRVSLELGTGVSYGDDYYGVSGGNHVFASASLPIAITGTLTLTPYIAHSWAIDSLDDLGEDDHLYGGAALSVDF